jgi:hypothetical protein
MRGKLLYTDHYIANIFNLRDRMFKRERTSQAKNRSHSNPGEFDNGLGKIDISQIFPLLRQQSVDIKKRTMRNA